jgi:ABC-type amino acid transport system permease subunit
MVSLLVNVIQNTPIAAIIAVAEVLETANHQVGAADVHDPSSRTRSRSSPA